MKKLSKTHFPNTTQFPSLLLSDLTSFCAFIQSHPLYFAYLILFFPYICPLLSFLYPLLLSTSLLLLSLLTTLPNLDNTPSNGFLAQAVKLVLDNSRTSIDSKDDDDDDYTKLSIFEPLASMASELKACMEPTAITYSRNETNGRREDESRQRLAQALTYNMGEEVIGTIGGDGKEDYGVVGLDSCRFGSMRREKEWKRTLACKLYEERQMVDGIEGMDLLWEVHEVDSGKFKVKNKDEKKKEKKAHREEEEEEDDLDGQLCCLQALRFSTAKMNLGMGRINSMRISKAFKGMGLFMRRERKIP